MTKRIKILFTIPNFDTAGSGKVVYDLVKGLDKTRFEPEICCVHDKGNYFKVVEALGVKIHLFPFSVPYRPFLTFPFRVFKIVRFFKQHEFDIIHSWHWSSDVSEPLAAKLAGIPFVYTKKAMGWGNKAWIWRSKLSTKIIAVNREMMELFFLNMKHKTVNIPLGVDTEYFKPDHTFPLNRKDLGLMPDNFVVITVANLVPVKGIEILIKAIGLLNDMKVKLVVVGDNQNDYGFALKKRYESKKILFLGKQQDVRPYLTLADLFVIPTIDIGEGLPIAPLEAMASQRIVLGSDVPGIKDILRCFPECLFQAGNVEKLTDKIKYIKEMPLEARDVLSMSMRKAVEDSFTIKKCLKEHETLYRNILKK